MGVRRNKSVQVKVSSSIPTRPENFWLCDHLTRFAVEQAMKVGDSLTDSPDYYRCVKVKMY
jgi:hypothetical protein